MYTGQVAGDAIKMGYVYILRSLKNSRYYIGSTVNFNRRLQQHKQGRIKATMNLLPIEKMFVQRYNTTRTAKKIEYWLKKQKDKGLIEKVILEGQITKKF